MKVLRCRPCRGGGDESGADGHFLAWDSLRAAVMRSASGNRCAESVRCIRSRYDDPVRLAGHYSLLLPG